MIFGKAKCRQPTGKGQRPTGNGSYLCLKKNHFAMKKWIPLCTLFFSSVLGSAQITLTSASFPATGDTLKFATDLTPDGIEVTPPGSDFNWDYTSLTATVNSETVFQDASAGSVAAEVPTATHVTIDPNTGAESYYRITSDEMTFVAANGEDPIGAGLQAIFRFQPPIVERRAPLDFSASNDSESNLSIAFAWDDLPAFITDSIPSPIIPDSIRVRVVQTRSDSVDAWGSLSIPGGDHEVLREKRTLHRDTRLDVLVEVPIIGPQWQDVTDLILATLPGGGGSIFQGLGLDTVLTYNFYSNDAKEAIAVVTMDDAGTSVMQVRYKDYGIVNSTEEPELLSVTVSPNPATELLRLELGDFPQGEFALKIFDLGGQLLLEKNFSLAGRRTENLDVSHLPAGSHVFQISDQRGKLFATGKFLKN